MSSRSSISDDDDEWELMDKPMSSSRSSSKTSSSIEVLESPFKPVPEKPSLEVERKFIVPSDYKDRLLKNGFDPVDQFRETLNDDYFDFVVGDFPLLTNDHWLRKRNGDWELKYPVGSTMSTSMSENDENVPTTTLYHETSNHDDILSKIGVIVPEITSNQDVGLNHLVDNATLKPFAQLETKRKCYKRSSDNVNIVVDVTDWGYMIGEIEVMVENKDQVTAATQQIDELAKKLGKRFCKTICTLFALFVQFSFFLCVSFQTLILFPFIFKPHQNSQKWT